MVGGDGSEKAGEVDAARTDVDSGVLSFTCFGTELKWITGR
jgi:hypothetical protein